MMRLRVLPTVGDGYRLVLDRVDDPEILEAIANEDGDGEPRWIAFADEVEL
jgi:hypothetical protein